MERDIWRGQVYAVVDDDAEVRQTLGLQLRRLGAEVAVYDGPQALLSELETVRPRAVVIDLMLGRHDGIQVLRQLADRDYPGYVLLLSGMEPKIIRIAMRVGQTLGLRMLPPLAKPYRAAALQEHLSSAASEPVLSTEGQGSAAVSLAEIDLALDEGEFVLHYQPEYDLNSGTFKAVEALVRWQNRRRGLLMPGQFLHAFSPRQMSNLSWLVVQQAIRDAERWRTAGRPLSVAVNVGADQVMDPILFGLLADRRRADSETAPLVLEITETESMDDELLGGELAARLRLHGVEIAVDDFGVGFSSLARLQSLPISELKIDRSFVRAANEEPADAAILRSVAALGRSLGIRVVAEGVENLALLPLLRDCGCHLAQGYALARPMPAADILALPEHLPS
ncbi:EAL domain-containing response regulator [Spiribacter halobius]|uniref:Diguanylate phosphodiesterase n=1 Tax=Sediminicurvatus halobius TaxID=2182432 RepID=A0A2U2MZ20_9GAMM|nr:EAL domain-containing response regulator [Spiribacter halobius]PWG62043.1 hypothetical protein DEM34_13760 [Spiribacter halobius]UEX78692.1 EAL domain-containing response regulator [Spiribacter halobius]